MPDLIVTPWGVQGAYSAHTRPLSVILYCRCSTEEQASAYSIEAQRDQCGRYCGLYGHTIARVIVDPALSGRKIANRPGALAALEALKAHQAEGLLVARLDRLTRNLKDLLHVLEHAEKHGWSLLSVTEQFDTSTASGRLVLHILGAVAQWERATISDRIKAALAARTARGYPATGITRIGYKKDRKGRLIPDPKEQPLLHRLIELYDVHLAGEMTVADVARQLSKEGFRTRKGKWIEANSVRKWMERARIPVPIPPSDSA